MSAVLVDGVNGRHMTVGAAPLLEWNIYIFDIKVINFYGNAIPKEEALSGVGMFRLRRKKLSGVSRICRHLLVYVSRLT